MSGQLITFRGDQVVWFGDLVTFSGGVPNPDDDDLELTLVNLTPFRTLEMLDVEREVVVVTPLRTLEAL